MTPADYAEVVALMETYFEGLHRAASAILRRVFHPRLAYVCAAEGDKLYFDLDTYMARVDGRESPAKRGDPRDEAILEIAFGSDRIARVTARMSMMGSDYLDFLTLVPHGGNWRIVTKACTYLPGKD